LANFFRDNADLRRRIESAPWAGVLPALEKDFTDPHELAPKSLDEAVEQIRMVLDMIGALAAEEVAPHAAEVDRVGAQLEGGKVVYPEPLQRAFRLLSEAGLMGFTLPREFGGMNLPITAYTAAVEMIARADASLMTLFALQGCGETIHRFAPRAVQERYLPRLCTGEITPCMALTEPNAGSALGAVSTKATQAPDGTWRLSGTKCFITNGGADLLLVLARSEDGKQGGEGLSLFLAERSKGVEVSKLEDKLGIHGSATAAMNLAQVPAVLLGRRGEGLYKVTLSLLHNVRLEVAAQAVGVAQAAQTAAVKYANERQQFGRTIDHFAPVRAMLFDNAAEIEAARAIVVTTAAVVDRKRGLERAGGGEELARYERLAELLTPLSKYYACEIVNAVTSRAIQVHGGYGYSREYAVERHFRDGRITSIYEGTSEIQVGAMIDPLLKGGLPLLFEEPLSDAPDPPAASGALGVLRADYEMMVQAAEIAAKADKFARQGWARPFADAVATIVSGLVFLNDAAKDPRSAILARRQAREGRRQAETLLRLVREGDKAAFDDESFGPVIGTYR
jgi:alkylation response protein AidB-like acyl-CoA dehydrogenase